MKTKFLFFDFDKTITKKDSIGLLWLYTIKRKPWILFYFIYKMLFSSIIYLINGRDFKYIKEAMLTVLNFNTEEELASFVKSYLWNNYMLEEGVNYLQEKVKEGFVAVLVSASCENYLKYVKDVLPFDYIIGTILTENYTLMGENNKSKEKVRRINKLLDDNSLEIDYEESFAFSDSYKDDKPMLELVKNKFLINSNLKKRDYQNLSWH